jgi:hypothetical protein
MSAKPKTTPMDAKTKNFGRRLWSIIGNESKYKEVHEMFFKEFNDLRDEVQASSYNKVTMVNHVLPIYDHIASQGYSAHIHYKPLIDAVTNFCEGKPVAAWKAPPDQFSRSSSPLLPPSPRPQSPKAEESSKKKDQAAISDDDSEKESGELVKSQNVTTDVAKSNNAEGEEDPNTEGMELCPTKCSKCTSRKHGCHINPKAAKKTSAACFECNHWRLKCSLAPPRVKKGEDEEEGILKEPVKRQGRKKPIQVPAGQPGQYTGKHVLLVDFSDISDIYLTSRSLVPGVCEKIGIENCCLDGENGRPFTSHGPFNCGESDNEGMANDEFQVARREHYQAG